MSIVKQLQIKAIAPAPANSFIKRWHYSGKVVPNSQLHFGVFLNGVLHGVMQFGPSLAKKKTMVLVPGTGWNEFIELNRMAFDPKLPKNSESRCLAIAIKLIKKHAPQIKWIISFADATSSGDGTIYRATGFLLTQVRPNANMFEHKTTGQRQHSIKFYHDKTKPDANWQKAKGYMLRYVYLIDKTCKIDAPILPYSTIDSVGAGMYLGKKVTLKDRQYAPAA